MAFSIDLLNWSPLQHSRIIPCKFVITIFIGRNGLTVSRHATFWRLLGNFTPYMCHRADLQSLRDSAWFYDKRWCYISRILPWTICKAPITWGRIGATLKWKLKQWDKTLTTSGLYKLLYKRWAKSMEDGDFRPPTAPRPLNRFSWNLKYITTSRTRPRTQNFSGLCRRGWSDNSQFNARKFCPFFFSSSRPQVALLDTSLRTIHSFRLGSAFGELKDEVWNWRLYPNNVTAGTKL